MPGEINPQDELAQNIANIELNEEELDGVSGGAKDTLKPVDLNQLQRLMEQKGQLESMISNTIKAGGDAQAGLGSNIKAS